MEESLQDRIKKYYQMAEEWAVGYLKENTEPMTITIKKGEIINDHLFYLDVSLERLRYSSGKEQYASYIRIKQFKDFVNKCKPIVDKII